MKKSTIALASASIAALLISASGDANAARGKKEKCFGISKKAMNDCASKKNGHSCAGQSKKDRDSAEWIYVSKGACDKIVGGSLTEK
jgi:uncharacterized membrane protein